MAHAGEGGSSKGNVSDKMKEQWKNESKASHQIGRSSSYNLFPERGQTNGNMAPQFDIFSMDQPQTNVMLPKQDTSRSEVLTLDLPKVTQFPFQAMKLPTFQPEGEVMDANETIGMNIPVQISNNANVPVSICGSTRFSNAPTIVQQGQGSQVTFMSHGGRSQPSYLPSHAPRPVQGSLEDFAEIMAVQQAYLCALHDLDQITPATLLHQSPHALVDHYAQDIHWISYPREIALQSQRMSGSFQVQQHFEQNTISHSGNMQQQMRSPMDSTLRIISMRGQIAGLCAKPHGSRMIQNALETATPEEIIMVYEEVIPYVRMLTIDVFANYAVQKLLEHGPPFYKRKFINKLIGHVLPLSLHMYGCRVIQKAIEVAEHDLKVQLASEFCGNVLKCARDQYANHVIQKCIECVPPQDIQFIFRSFCRKAKVFSTTSSGCHIIQKVLTFCNNPQIYHTIVSEIMESVVKLASDPFANYVVQHIVERGGPVERTAIVKKFDRRVVSMCYQKYSSNVIEKCLTVGSLEDRRLITTEIFTAGHGHFDHLLDMMCHMYANFVIQKVATAADEGQLRVLVEVARCNMGTIMRYQHGRQVLAHIQQVLMDRGMPSDIQGYVLGGSS